MATSRIACEVYTFNVLITIEVKSINIRTYRRLYYIVPLLRSNVFSSFLVEVEASCVRETPGSNLDRDTDYPV
jgi:hypothetical protein